MVCGGDDDVRIVLQDFLLITSRPCFQICNVDLPHYFLLVLYHRMSDRHNLLRYSVADGHFSSFSYDLCCSEHVYRGLFRLVTLGTRWNLTVSCVAANIFFETLQISPYQPGNASFPELLPTWLLVIF